MYSKFIFRDVICVLLASGAGEGLEAAAAARARQEQLTERQVQGLPRGERQAARHHGRAPAIRSHVDDLERQLDQQTGW